MKAVYCQSPYCQRRQILKLLASRVANSSSCSSAQMLALTRARTGFITETSQCLELIRKLVQKKINQEIDSIIKKYLETYFKMGIENICQNNGRNAVSDEHIHAVCRQILEDAKKLYPIKEVSLVSNVYEMNNDQIKKHPNDWISLSKMKEQSQEEPSRPKHGILEQTSQICSPNEAASWQSCSKGYINKIYGSFFVTNHKACQFLPIVQDAPIFRYQCDFEDQEWLIQQQLMMPTESSVQLLLVDEVLHLEGAEEACQSLQGFLVPQFLEDKMRKSLQLYQNVDTNPVPW